MKPGLIVYKNINITKHFYREKSYCPKPGRYEYANRKRKFNPLSQHGEKTKSPNDQNTILEKPLTSGVA